jgi:hypothetical protein
VRKEFEPTYTNVKARAVHDAFTIEPGGQTLGELAEELELWSPATTE